jgi:diadenosine tetraphosphate (Ap4A) HIT family hydrolase
MDNCIFCKIVKGELPSVKIWEDGEFLAILDMYPNTKGVTLIIPKDHYDSYVFDMPDEFYQKIMQATKKVVKMLEKGLGVQRIAMVMEGLLINHAHIKLYPIHRVDEKFKECESKEVRFFEKYEGYITTQLGPEVDIAGRKKLADEIMEKNK